MGHMPRPESPVLCVCVSVHLIMEDGREDRENFEDIQSAVDWLRVAYPDSWRTTLDPEWYHFASPAKKPSAPVSP